MNPVERLLGAVINPVVDAVDVDGVVSKVDIDRLVNEVDLNSVLEKVDLDALLQTVDLNTLIQSVDLDALLQKLDLDALIQRIDLNTLIQSVDLNALLDKIDLNALLDKIDLNRILEKVDLDALLAKVDLDALLDKIDLDALLQKVDVAGLAKQAGIDEIVADATRGVSARVLAMARRQIVGLDLIVSGIWARLVHRPRPEPPAGTSATGAVAGPVSRLLAYFVDIAALSVGFSVLTAIVSYLVQLFFSEQIDTGRDNWGWAFATGYFAFAFVYWLVGLTVAGSSLGKALLGLRVLNLDGTPIRGRQAFVRVVVYPFSFILGLGLVPIVTARSHRALHDKAARTTVRYDWGDSDEAPRSPLTRWLRGKSAGDWVLEEAHDRGAKAA